VHPDDFADLALLQRVDVEPGTLLWFNNKLKHGTENIGDCTRITFVFDVPQKKLTVNKK
jgi:hypothetical protein